MTLRAILVLGGVLAFAAPAWAQPSAPPTKSEPLTFYTVKKGDTLWTLASQYFIRLPTYDEVRVRNHVRRVRRLKIGLQLEIPTRLLRREPVDARLGAFRGAVSVTGGGAAGAPSVGMVVGEGAVVTTEGGAFARLDLADGSRVSVPSQSRLRIDDMHRILLTGAVERSLTVLSGRSESIVTPLPARQDSYIVKTPVSVSAVRGTDFRVVYAPGDTAASTGVVEGKVGVDGDAGSVVVPVAFGVGVRPGQSLTVVPLLPSPTVRQPGRVQDEAQVAFDIEAQPGAKGYRMQLAADAGMLDLFAEQTAADPHIAFDGLADGDYFVRVTALDPSQIEGLPHIYAFERALNTLTTQAVASSGQRGARRFLLKWETGGEGDRTYRVQVTREGAAEGPVIDEGGLKTTQLTLTNLPPGDYHWQVMSATARKGRYIEKWSAPQTFTVSAE